MTRIIGHIDMDAFFASIEERDHPRLAGRPIVVGADPEDGRGRGVVSTANYAARVYGIRSALPISTAWRYSEAAHAKGQPRAVFMGVDMEKYATVSGEIMEILRAHLTADEQGALPLIEQASVDEAYFDLSFAKTYERATEIARAIKFEIKEKEKLTASIGIGSNKLIAKIASDRQKPDGLTVVHEKDAEAFLEPLSVRVIPGVGPKAEQQFNSIGIRTIRDAKRLTLAELYDMMGVRGEDLYEKLRGRSDAPIVMEWVQKSISENETFREDVPIGPHLSDRKKLEAALAELAADVYCRFIKEVESGVPFKSFRSIGITVRFSDFSTKTRIVTLSKLIAANDPTARDTIQFQALRLFMPFLDRRENPDYKAIRLLGVKVERFE